MENTSSRLSVAPGYPWKIFWVLTVACLLGFAAGMPYIYALFRNLVAPTPLSMPLPVLITVQLMQSTFVFGGVVALGLLLTRKGGIQTPILQRWLYRRDTVMPRDWLRLPLLVGLGIGVLVCLAYFLVFLPLIPNWPVQAEAAVPLWKRLLVCFYTAINIEVVMRLFLLSLFLWLLKVITRTSARSGNAVFWIANIIVALIYAAGHLPAAKSVMQLTPIVVAGATVPTGLFSIAFGYLAWKRGLEAAILAHFSADLVLHLIGPMLFRG